jgi:hypothetical protein
MQIPVESITNPETFVIGIEDFLHKLGFHKVLANPYKEIMSPELYQKVWNPLKFIWEGETKEGISLATLLDLCCVILIQNPQKTFYDKELYENAKNILKTILEKNPDLIVHREYFFQLTSVLDLSTYEGKFGLN